jgi:hypothetical protein
MLPLRSCTRPNTVGIQQRMAELDLLLQSVEVTSDGEI